MKSILTIILCFTSLFLVAGLWENNLVLTILLLLLAAIFLLLERSKKELALFLVCSIGGALAETFAIYFGAWEYSNPNLYVIPIWLPILWGIASIAIMRMYFMIKRLSKRFKPAKR